MSLRMEKVNNEIRKRIMEIIQRELDDPYLEFVSITRVKTTPDLKECRVYFSVLRDQDFPRTEKALNTMRGFIRKILGKKLRIKILPSLRFYPDKGIKYSVEIYKKIDEVIGNEKSNRSY